ncbi:hypothetical protein [Aeromonas caviae]|uniref:hypothetical protein n=1 Tax=Aeromonas caviae TaxID=648 RepID=UPI0029DDAE43|nr:hypothetical protein [Aeromonas caviae]MDX7767997.1 hypothetical protein [Aeromonas caviae]
MTQEFGKTFKVYRQDLSMAATFQAVKAQAGYLTVRLELAPMSGSNAHWENKWGINISFKELHAVASVLTGIKKTCTGTFHGEGKNHSYDFSNNGAGIQLVIHFAGHRRSITLNGSDSFWLSTLVIDAIAKNAPPGFASNLIIPLIQRTQF